MDRLKTAAIRLVSFPLSQLSRDLRMSSECHLE